MKLSRLYLSTVLLLMLIFPVVSLLIEYGLFHARSSMPELIGKWFTFWAIGLRLFTAGVRQVIKPVFTAKDIFHLEGDDALVIVRELGYANICLGATAIVSLFIPGWRIAAAFAGGLYMGIAGINHIIKEPASPNEVLAMVSDIFISIVMAVSIICTYL